MNTPTKTSICLVLALTMVSGFSIPAFASEPHAARDAQSSPILGTFQASDKVLQENMMAEIFRLIETTPNHVLESLTEQELMEYFNANSDLLKFQSAISGQLHSPNNMGTYGWWENTKCGAAIVLAVGGTVFVGAKLLKFKKYIKALGGAKEAAYLVYLYFHYGKVPEHLGSSVGGFVINLAEMILGIDTIKEQCGHLIHSHPLERYVY